MQRAKLNFLRQQGWNDTTPQGCDITFPAAMWQPRVIGVLVLIGWLFETGWFFVALSAILWWNVVVPRFNLFDAIYYRVVKRGKGLPPLGPAPAPRRFAQAVAAVFMLVIGVALIRGNLTLAWAMWWLLLFFLALLVFGRFCLGSYLYHLFTGKAAFANRTLPWNRG